MFTICFSLHKRRYWGDARDTQRERKAKITPVVGVRCLSSTNTSTTNEERTSVKNWRDHKLEFQSKVVSNYLWQFVNRFLANSFPSREELPTNRALARQMLSKTVEDMIATKKWFTNSRSFTSPRKKSKSVMYVAVEKMATITKTSAYYDLTYCLLTVFVVS